jgi:hypothetical protein
MTRGELRCAETDIYDVGFLAVEGDKKVVVRMGYKDAALLARQLTIMTDGQHKRAQRYAANNPACKCEICEGVR